MEHHRIGHQVDRQIQYPQTQQSTQDDPQIQYPPGTSVVSGISGTSPNVLDTHASSTSISGEIAMSQPPESWGAFFQDLALQTLQEANFQICGRAIRHQHIPELRCVPSGTRGGYEIIHTDTQGTTRRILGPAAGTLVHHCLALSRENAPSAHPSDEASTSGRMKPPSAPHAPTAAIVLEYVKREFDAAFGTHESFGNHSIHLLDNFVKQNGYGLNDIDKAGLVLHVLHKTPWPDFLLSRFKDFNIKSEAVRYVVALAILEKHPEKLLQNFAELSIDRNDRRFEFAMMLAHVGGVTLHCFWRSSQNLNLSLDQLLECARLSLEKAGAEHLDIVADCIVSRLSDMLDEKTFKQKVNELAVLTHTRLSSMPQVFHTVLRPMDVNAQLEELDVAPYVLSCVASAMQRLNILRNGTRHAESEDVALEKIRDYVESNFPPGEIPDDVIDFMANAYVAISDLHQYGIPDGRYNVVVRNRDVLPAPPDHVDPNAVNVQAGMAKYVLANFARYLETDLTAPFHELLDDTARSVLIGSAGCHEYACALALVLAHRCAAPPESGRLQKIENLKSPEWGDQEVDHVFCRATYLCKNGKGSEENNAYSIVLDPWAKTIVFFDKHGQYRNGTLMHALTDFKEYYFPYVAQKMLDASMRIEQGITDDVFLDEISVAWDRFASMKPGDRHSLIDSPDDFYHRETLDMTHPGTRNVPTRRASFSPAHTNPIAEHLLASTGFIAWLRHNTPADIAGRLGKSLDLATFTQLPPETRENLLVKAMEETGLQHMRAAVNDVIAQMQN